MSSSQPPGAAAVSLDQLIALNDEIAALVRAGLPLERGLAAVGRDVSGALGETMRSLAERMGRGATLPQAIDAHRESLPRVYRAVVEAGIRAGRLPAALEALASVSKNVAELRRIIGTALLYPLLVLTLGYSLFIGFMLAVVPRLREFIAGTRLHSLALLDWLSAAGESVAVWGPMLPVLLVLVLLVWIRSGRAARLGAGFGVGLLGIVPGVRAMLVASRAAAFSEMLAVLIEHELPLPAALELAAESMGDPAAGGEAQRIAAALRRGESPARAFDGSALFPPLLRWVVSFAPPERLLVSALRHATARYRRQATDGADAVRLLFPIGILLVVGATVTLLYGLTLFVPLTEVLHELSRE